jgi:uncharacterized protein (DUF983 family)
VESADFSSHDDRSLGCLRGRPPSERVFREYEVRGCMTPSGWKLISAALRRGLRKRCPHCGEGPLFSGWSHHEKCSVCGLVFVRSPGDTWAFTIIGDRLPIMGLIVLIYFGVVRSHPVLGLTMGVGLVALLIWTSPNRWGAGIALHYLSRVYWPDPADPIPPPS